MYIYTAILLALSTIAVASDVYLTWNLTWQNSVQVDPSLPSKKLIVINGTWPPPVTTVNVNDTIYLNVINSLDASTSTTLHAHGFLQRDNNLYDGPEGITQCGIRFQQQFQYIWNAVQPGTFWVHSHHVGQYPYGLRAPLIVRNHAIESSNYVYGRDFPVSMSEWFNIEQADVDNMYHNGTCGAGLEYPPNAIIMNELVESTINAGSTSAGRIRFRFINMSAFATMIIYLSGGMQMTVIEIDGTPLNYGGVPSKAKAIELNSGQRISVVVDPVDNGNQNFNIYSTIDETHYGGNSCAARSSNAGPAKRSIVAVKFDGQPERAALERYEISKAISAGAPPSYDNTYMWVSKWDNPSKTGMKLVNLPSYADKFADDTNVVSDNWYFSKLPPFTPVPRILYRNGTTPQTQTRLIYLSLTASGPNHNLYANLNDVTFTGPAADSSVLLQAIRPSTPSCPANKSPNLSNLGPQSFYGSQNTYTIEQGEQVIVVISSYIGAHTFHLHGHDFQVLYHQSEFDPAFPVRIPGTPAQPDAWRIRSNNYNMPTNPLRRDTLFITKKTYSIIAFTADNPGAWFFHCHNDFHAMSGMAGVFVTGQQGANGLQGFGAPGIWGDVVYKQCKGGNPGDVAGYTRACIPS